MDKWLDQIHMMECYSFVKTTCAATQKDHGDVLPSEWKSQAQKEYCVSCDSVYIKRLERAAVCRLKVDEWFLGAGGAERECGDRRARAAFHGDENVLALTPVAARV